MDDGCAAASPLCIAGATPGANRCEPCAGSDPARGTDDGCAAATPFFQRHKLPARGDYVFFDPPPGELLRRHFGAKPQMFGKIAYGVPGDIISHIGRTVAVNGHPVAQMKPFTRFGEPLTPGATGRVPAGCYFAATPHKDGFDSRYGEIGFVCGRQIIGTGEPIL